MSEAIIKIPEEVPGVFSVYDIGEFAIVAECGAEINEPIVESGTPGDAVWDELERLFIRLTP